MEKKNAIVWNINAMRPAIQRAYERGNKTPIAEKLCKDCGIEAGFFKAYSATMKKLYDAVQGYVFAKHTVDSSDEDRAEALAKIAPAWAELLTCAERDKTSTDLKATPDDIYDLVAFCQKFVRDRNDLSFGADEKFVALQVWASEEYRRFVKYVETDLGLRIARVNILTDERRDFLRDEGKIVRGIKRVMGDIKSIEADIVKLNELGKKFKGKEAKSIFAEQIAEKTAKLNEAKGALAQLHKELDELHNPADDDDDDEAEVAPAETPAEAPAKKPAKAAAKKSGKKSSK